MANKNKAIGYNMNWALSAYAANLPVERLCNHQQLTNDSILGECARSEWAVRDDNSACDSYTLHLPAALT